MLRAVTVVVALVLLAAGPAQAQAPPNDAFANPITLTTGPVSGNTNTATFQAGEPSHSDEVGQGSVKSLWYRWTAPANQTVQFDTCTTDYDTHLGVWTGSAVQALTLVRRNNNAGCAPPGDPAEWGSRVVFNARKGVEYRIAVAGCCGNDDGDFTLTLTRPGNHNFAQRMPLGGAAASVMSEIKIPDPNQPGEAGGGTNSVWYEWTAPTSGVVAADTCGQTASAIDSRLTVYTGATLAGLTQVPGADNDDTPGCVILSGNQRGSSVTFAATAGTTYVIRVAQTQGSQSRFRLRINPSALANDQLAGARGVVGRSPATDESTFGASHEHEEPIALVPFSGGSLWYRWTAPFGGEAVTVDSCGSAVPTRVRAFSGTTLVGLQPVGSANDSACPGGTVLRLTPAAGASYAFQADNTTATQGAARLNWSPETFISDAGVSGGTAQFHFDAHDGTPTNGDRLVYSCSLDGATFRSCDSPETYRGLSARRHTFAVRAIDFAGSVDPSPATTQFTTTAPGSTTGPPGPAGPRGRDGQFVVAIAPARLTSVAGKRLRVPFVSTNEARVTLQIRRGRRVVARVSGRAKRGRNRIVWNGKVRRKAAKAGRYTVRLSGAIGAARASDQVPLRITKRR